MRSEENTPLPRRARGDRFRLAKKPHASHLSSIDEAEAPQRLQKILAQSGLGSRRDMEMLIEQGRVSVNGQRAQLGQRIGPSDRVRVEGRLMALKFPRVPPRVILYHKPEGEIVSRDDPQARASVFDRLPSVHRARWVSVGRLDYNTCGLLIFTTSGELAHRLMHPRFEAEREYAVRIRGRLDEAQLKRLIAGVALPEGRARMESVEEGGGEGANHWYRVVVEEGRNRLVRRMFEELGFTVSRLMRTRFGPISLPPRLRRGQWMELPAEEVRKLLEWAKMRAESAPVRRQREESPRGPGKRGKLPSAFKRYRGEFRGK